MKKKKKKDIERLLYPADNIIFRLGLDPLFSSVQFSGSVVSDSAAPWTAALQTSLSITNSWGLLKLMSIELVMQCNHLLGLKPSQNPGNCFQDQMKLKFLMSHHRKNSVRDEVMGKKWIYSDSKRSTLHRQSVGHCRGQCSLMVAMWHG